MHQVPLPDPGTAMVLLSWDLESTAADAEITQDMAYCFKGLASISLLGSCSFICSLNVSFNSLSSLAGIENLSGLKQLNISHNHLTDLQPISALQCLTQLLCGHNQIHSTSDITDLRSLQFLALHDNSIRTAAAVLMLSQLTSLQHLTLCNNPICSTSNWKQGTLGMLTDLQALDNTIISSAQRAEAVLYADLWAAAAESDHCSHPAQKVKDGNMPASGDKHGAGHEHDSHATGGAASCITAASKQHSRANSSSAGRQRSRPRGIRVPLPAPDDSTGIKDATSMLPSMTVQLLKPSSLVRRPVEAMQPSKYGYSRAKPLRVLHKEMYKDTDSTALIVHSDGSASMTWPDGSMAATLDVEDSTAAGSTATNSTGSSSVPPIKGYRLLAMYNNMTSVAASCDSTGGFVQWPNGQLMLVWDKKGGTAYNVDGQVAQKFTRKRTKATATEYEIDVQLDQHFSIRFSICSHDLLLTYACEGCQAALSRKHGAVLPGRGSHSCTQALMSAEIQSSKSGSQEACKGLHAQAQQAQHPVAAAEQLHLEPPLVAAEPQAGQDPDAGDTHALLARARALLLADEAPASADLPASAVSGHSFAEAAVLTAPKDHPLMAQEEFGNTDTEELSAMMARARAAVTALQSASLCVQLQL